MAITWDDNLFLGFSDIDDQHREIFSRFDTLSQACQERKGNTIVKGLLDFLDEYVSHHFSCEETLMDRYAYPRFEEQREQHAIFRQEIEALHVCSTEGMDEHELALLIDRKLVRWLIQHIRNLDRDMITFVKTRQQSEEGK